MTVVPEKLKNCCKIVDNALVLQVRLTPSARQQRINGVSETHDGESWLAVGVTPPPDKGKANAALVKLLSKVLGVAKSSISIVHGELSRQKRLRIEGDVRAIVETLSRHC